MIAFPFPGGFLSRREQASQKGLTLSELGPGRDRPSPEPGWSIQDSPQSQRPGPSYGQTYLSGGSAHGDQGTPPTLTVPCHCARAALPALW